MVVTLTPADSNHHGNNAGGVDGALATGINSNGYSYSERSSRTTTRLWAAIATPPRGA
jgi:hypothetical protein